MSKIGEQNYIHFIGNGGTKRCIRERKENARLNKCADRKSIVQELAGILVFMMLVVNMVESFLFLDHEAFEKARMIRHEEKKNVVFQF